MPLMTHSAIPDQVIDVPAGAMSYWQTRGWAAAAVGLVVTPRGRVAVPAVFTLAVHPSLPGRTFRLPFSTIPGVWSSLGWTVAP